MVQLPRHILKALRANKTSLGDHPAYPPEEEEHFIINAVAQRFTELCKDDERFEMMEVTSTTELKNTLSKLVAQCQKIESQNKAALESFCVEVVKSLFGGIPEDTVSITTKLVTSVNVDNQRMVPEKTGDFSFDSIDDMNTLGSEIYKRRMLNALVCGAAMYYSGNISRYLNTLFDIDSELPALYKKLLEYNELLLFFEKDDTSEEAQTTDGGKVDVTMGGAQNIVKIEAEGLIFPILLEETIKGFLELAIAHGLPKERAKAEYVMKKADFKLAEVWDMRLGSTLWGIIMRQLEEINADGVEPNFLLMTLAEMDADEFNETLMEVFAKTRKGKQMLKDVVDGITRAKDEDEFNDFINGGNEQPLLGDGYYTSEELIVDCEY